MRTRREYLVSPGDRDAVVAFTGPYRWLSNFYQADVIFEGLRYPSTEHAYQAAKTLSPKRRYQIAHLGTPAEAKRAGRSLPLRADWEDVKHGIMRQLVREKFTRHADLRERLLATGSVLLIEGNLWHDLYFGRCVCPIHRGKGQNVLGELLMQIRSELRG